MTFRPEQSLEVSLEDVIKNTDRSTASVELNSNWGCEAYLSPRDVARRIPYSIKTLERLRHMKRGPRWSKVGRRIFYKWTDVVSWIEKSTNQ